MDSGRRTTREERLAEAKAAFDAGVALYTDKKYAMAIEKFNVAIEFNPALDSAYLKRANAITHLDNKELYYQAIADFETFSLFNAMKKRGDAVQRRTEVLFEQGKMYFVLEHYKEAIRCLDKAIETDGIDPDIKKECRKLIVSCYVERAQTFKTNEDEHRISLLKAAAYDDNHSVNVSAVLSGDPKTLSDFIKEHIQPKKLQYILLHKFLQQDMELETLAPLPQKQKDSGPSLNPDSSYYWYRLGQKHKAEGLIAESLKNFQMCVVFEKIAEEPDQKKIRNATREMGMAYRQLNQPALADVCLTEAADDINSVVGIGFFKPQASTTSIEAKEADVANQFFDQGSAYYQEKNYRSALDCFNTALALNPALTKVYLNRANVVSHLKEPRDYYQAIADYDLHCLLNPGDKPEFMAGIALRKAYRYEDLGCYDTAIRLIHEAMVIEENEEKTGSGKFGKSIKADCKAALDSCKQKMKATTEKDEQEIIPPLLEEKNLKSYWDKANAHYKKNKYKQAIELCHAMIAFKPAYREAYHLRAECYLGLGKKAEAIADFHVFHALEKIAPSPKSQVALAGSHLGQAYYSVKQFDRAIALFTESIAQEKNRTTFRERAKAYAASGNLALAIRDYCEAIALSFDKEELYKPKKGLEKLLEKKDPKKILDVLKTIEPLEDQLKILTICRDDAEHPLSRFFLESALFSMSGIINAIDAQIEAVEGELKKQKTEAEQASTVRVHVSRKPGQGGS